MKQQFLHESLLVAQSDHKLRCDVCARRCLLGVGAYGWCRTRRNQNGRLVTFTYGAISSAAAEPIEKKPFHHFYPRTLVYTAGSWSCNFGCPWCQNWCIARVKPPSTSAFVSPQRFVEMTMNANCQGIALSYNEPALSFEWSLDVFRLAHRQGLFNTYVTNGYLTPEALSLLVDAGLDAMNVDIKGTAAAVRKYCKGVDVEHVWQTCRLARSRGVHLEVTTLVIPTVNDSAEALSEIARRIAAELGPNVPWHVSGYYPAYHFSLPPTPRATLERARQIGKDAGLEFVYVGNVPGYGYANTHCPGCGTLLIERTGYEVTLNALHAGHCPRCARAIAGVWSGGERDVEPHTRAA